MRRGDKFGFMKQKPLSDQPGQSIEPVGNPINIDAYVNRDKYVDQVAGIHIVQNDESF